MKNYIFEGDVEFYLELIELAKFHGKKEGESMQEEFEELIQKYPNRIKCLGETEMDKDLLLGNIREETKAKILDLTNGGENEKKSHGIS